MAVDIEEFRSSGVLPTGPVSAWPKDRHDTLMSQVEVKAPSKQVPKTKHATKVKAGVGRMAAGLAANTFRAVTGGKVSEEVRQERYETCKACPLFIEESKRCADCGCFMEAKTWINANPDVLCPQQKWAR